MNAGGLGFAVASFFAGFAAEGFKNKIVSIATSFNAIFWVTLGIAIAGMMHVTNIWVYLVGTMANFSLMSFAWPITVIIISHQTPAEYRCTLFAVWISVIELTSVVGGGLIQSLETVANWYTSMAILSTIPLVFAIINIYYRVAHNGVTAFREKNATIGIMEAIMIPGFLPSLLFLVVSGLAT